MLDLVAGRIDVMLEQASNVLPQLRGDTIRAYAVTAKTRIAERAGWTVAKVYRDHGISGGKGRDQRPAFDELWKDACSRKFDIVMAWSVDRLGRSARPGRLPG
jgi:DNA invertase Pin-like site-specific DNA recombinase